MCPMASSSRVDGTLMVLEPGSQAHREEQDVLDQSLFLFQGLGPK